MKIALLAHLKYPIRQPFAGGLEMHTHLLARSLRRRGHDVTVFAAAGSDVTLGLSVIAPPTGESHGDAVLERAIVDAETRAYGRMMNQVAAGAFDIVHNNSLHSLPLRAAPRLGAPMVTTLHTPPFRPLASAVGAAAGRHTFVAVSRALSAQWTEIVVDTRIIANGIDLSAFTPTLEAPPVRQAFWSGRIVPEKGLHLAIDAARHAALPLRFAGPRLDAAYWTAEIAPRLGPDVTDLGHLSHADLARHLAEASVAIVSPCWDEPFGLVVAEALACGTPVAAFSRGAIPDLVDTRCAALARPGDVLDLGRAAAAAASLDREACRLRAERHFDSETMTDAYEGLYGLLIDSAGTPPRRALGIPHAMRFDPAEA